MTVATAGAEETPRKTARMISKKKFTSWFIPEPLLIFGNGKTHIDPRLGLTLYGPLRAEEANVPSPMSIKVGIVGTGETIELATRWVERLMRKIPGSNQDAFQNPSFPGFKEAFDCILVHSEAYDETIPNSEIEDIPSEPTFEGRVGTGVRMFIDRIEAISERVPKPDVVLCALPQKIVDYCVVRRTSAGAIKIRVPDSQKKFVEKLKRYKAVNQTFLDNFGEEAERLIEGQPPTTTNFWRALKARVMTFGMPTQIVWPSTLQARENMQKGASVRQDEASIAWNASVGIYYKGSGFPWTMTRMRKGTCYVGVSFFKDLTDEENRMRTSLAQIFTYTGEGLVLRGERFKWDVANERSPHLTEEGAEALLKRAISLYSKRMLQPPTRVVVHKTSRYLKDEKAGFMKALEGIPLHDLVAFGDRGIRFFRYGNFPPIRGTVIQTGSENYLLYTRGYIPYLRTYPGARVPWPLDIVEHFGDSPATTVLTEILALSKMNWNSAEFSIAKPITLLFSERVGEVMASLPEDVTPKHEYLFYM